MKRSTYFCATGVLSISNLTTHPLTEGCNTGPSLPRHQSCTFIPPNPTQIELPTESGNLNFKCKSIPRASQQPHNSFTASVNPIL